jgi:flagellar hook-associated protein 1 FlgK
MSSTYRQLDSVEKSIATAVSDAVSPTGYSVSGKLNDQVNRINEILESVKNLTEQIKKVYALNQQPNDLLDQRDALLEELSGYVPVTVKFGYNSGKPDGSISELKIFNITVDLDNFDKGEPGNRFNLVSSDADATEITLQLGSVGTGNEISLTDNYSTVQQGSLMGLEKARQDLIGFQRDLGTLATELMNQIGYVGKTDLSSSTIDIPFFTGSLSGNDFNVNSDLVETPNKIHGPEATRVSGLWDDPIDNLGDTTFEEFYSSLVTKVGNSAKSADNMASTNSAIARQVTALRDSVSGVSVDEELTRMVQFQYGFQASARVINTLDGMLDVIINRLF